jgi:hypothetical protein
MFQVFNELGPCKRVSNRPTVETTRRIDVWGKGGGWRPTRTGEYTINGTLLTVVADAPMPRCQQRLWWLCPQCQRRTRFLYILDEQMRCRDCAGPLHYSIRYGDRASRVQYIKRLRLRAGISEDLFDRIPRRQPRYVKYARLVARIRHEEAKLRGYIHDMVEGLDELRRDAGLRLRRFDCE